jgi:hypothetical protein
VEDLVDRLASLVAAPDGDGLVARFDLQDNGGMAPLGWRSGEWLPRHAGNVHHDALTTAETPPIVPASIAAPSC